MKKCTLCVDRIYNEALPEADRQPACVRTCPANARHFGDLGDPDSGREPPGGRAGRHGPDAGDGHASPVNKYLPPRPRDEALDTLAPLLAPVAETPAGLLGWLDRALDRLP